jgi:hypothetical protein
MQMIRHEAVGKDSEPVVRRCFVKGFQAVMNSLLARKLPMTGGGIQREAVSVRADVVEYGEAGRRSALWTEP